jgi:hypothetical protein
MVQTRSSRLLQVAIPCVCPRNDPHTYAAVAIGQYCMRVNSCRWILSWAEIAEGAPDAQKHESQEMIFELSVGIATCRFPFKGSVYSV